MTSESPSVSGTEESEPSVSDPTETTNNTVESSTTAQPPQKPNDNTFATSSKPTTPPASSQAPAATSKPTEQPKTDPPATSTPTPVFNAQTYYDYALSYGKSIGLIYYSDMNIEENAWNAPQNLYDALSDETMKRNIRSGCDFIKFEGFEYFGLYLEKQPNGTTYRLYIMYG
jgi:hypothetical protein